jgi:hypothetical protein
LGKFLSILFNFQIFAELKKKKIILGTKKGYISE